MKRLLQPSGPKNLDDKLNAIFTTPLNLITHSTEAENSVAFSRKIEGLVSCFPSRLTRQVDLFS
jgi:hypothetical protein